MCGCVCARERGRQRVELKTDSDAKHPDVNVTQIRGARGSLTLRTQVCVSLTELQMSTDSQIIFDHSDTRPGRSGGTVEYVVMAEDTGDDRPSMWSS